MSSLRPIFMALLLLAPVHAMAEALVLLQGYLGNDDPWRRSGAAAALLAAGWSDGGHLVTTPHGIINRGPRGHGSRRFYTLALDTEAPLLVQARQLEPYVADIRRQHTGETLYLVGYSAGGVVGRLYMVQHPQTRVGALITIGSPHLGTASAEAGLLAGQSPLGLIAPLLGADGLNRSQGLYHDLAREQPGSLLFWLNRQPHPQSRYISVVHRGGGLLGIGDLIVPQWSQDMNNVPVLRGRVQTIAVAAGHELRASDGKLLVEILRRLHSS